MVIETKRSITYWANAANQHRNTTGWERWSNRNCAWNVNLTLRTNGICQLRTYPGEWDAQPPTRDFELQTDHLFSAWRPNIIIINNNKNRSCKIVDFALSADLRVKLKEREQRDKYLDLARELKKLWNMKVMIISIVVGILGIVTKGLVKGLEDLEIRRWVETTQTTALLRSARILREVPETWWDLLSLELQWKTIGWRWYDNLSQSKIIIIIIIKQ